MSKKIKYQIGVQLKDDDTKILAEPMIDVMSSKNAEEFVKKLKAGLDPYMHEDYEIIILIKD